MGLCGLNWGVFQQAVLFCDVLARVFRRDRYFVTAKPADRALTKGKQGSLASLTSEGRGAREPCLAYQS
jgi:hypothetical protein